jgi:hypothetical protein
MAEPQRYISHGKREKWEVGKALQRLISSLQPFSSFLWQL